MSLSTSEKEITKGKDHASLLSKGLGICPICGTNKWLFKRCYTGPDKYEECVGIAPPIQRVWSQCSHCGFFKCTRNYDLSLLDVIYDNGYRAKGFREENISETFEKIINLPEEQSENKQRVKWLKNVFESHKYSHPVPSIPRILDVGAGLGVFLAELCAERYIHFWKPNAFEPTKAAAEFLADKLDCHVWPTRYQPGLKGKVYDVVSCIHTLEHMEFPEDFLVNVREYDLVSGGRIFLEVPDAIEFDYLANDHDEFNSCHIHFYTPDTLYRLVESAGYKVTDLHRGYHRERNLSRIRLVALC